MLKIYIPGGESYDERTNEFLYADGMQLTLEHSLLSISKWESTWKKPFLSNKPMTTEEFRDYVRCMTLTQNVNPLLYNFLTQDNMRVVEEYIKDPMTATWFNDKGKKNSKKEINTSEVFYYMMFVNQIPKDCEKWHFNRLMTLLRVFAEKNGPEKKMATSEIYARNKALNAQRRAKYHTKG